MATRKDSSFQSSSLGRAQGARLNRESNASHESLTTHPLLSSTSSSGEIANGTTLPKYVPYTPRQRVTTTQVAVQPPVASFGSSQGGATPQLQLQNLKAAAQNIQLSPNSIGWAICEKLYSEGEKPEWEELWTALISNKATLLLPMDQLSPQDTVSSDFVRDHIVYCTPPSNKAAPVVSLSGLRGTLIDNTLTFRSMISTTSTKFQSLANNTSRSSSFAALAPLPTPLIVPLTPEYPVFNIPMPYTTLPFPSQPLHKVQSRTPLPATRLGPFASLFGSRPSPVVTPVSLPSVSVSEESDIGSLTIDVPVYVIQGRITRKDVVAGMGAALKTELTESLTGLPTWMVDKALEFTSPLYPSLSKEQPTASSPNAKSIFPDLTSPTSASESFQLFYTSLENELRSQQEKDGSLSEKRLEAHDEEAEVKNRLTIERVERAICALFYDQLFRPNTSDDASHDEALASRIAALNMLDLGLEHLGIDVGKAGSGVQAVVTAVGRTLQGLQDSSCRAPVDKAAVLLAAHQVAVEGLSKLPPICLKPDDEIIDSEPTPKVSSFKENASPKPDLTRLQLPDTALPLVREDSGNTESPIPSLQTASPRSQVSSLPSFNADAVPTPVASDILLPLMIYSVVKANPPELVSHLLYVQRYRMHSAAGGEEGFCLINLLAVAEFLENVDLAALGLGDSARVLSVADLAPLPLTRNPFDDKTDHPSSPLSLAGNLRGRVNQQVGELAGSANKVISDVFDSSFSVLRGILAVGGVEGALFSPEVVTEPSGGPNLHRPGFGLLRRASGFSIASVTSSLPALQRVTTHPRRASGTEEIGQMLVEVPSRPDSVGAEREDYSDDSEPGSDNEESEEEYEESGGAGLGARSDARSVRSLSSMMSAESRDRISRLPLGSSERKTLGDRLANVSVRSRLAKDTGSSIASPPSRRTSLLAKELPTASISSRPVSPSLRIAPPQDRFLHCQEGDLRLSEVGELLKEYQRVVQGLRAVGGFHE